MARSSDHLGQAWSAGLGFASAWLRCAPVDSIRLGWAARPLTSPSILRPTMPGDTVTETGRVAIPKWHAKALLCDGHHTLPMSAAYAGPDSEPGALVERALMGDLQMRTAL